ncbi:hypothetical protein OH76DRAFT_223889 [Lentinus brumalis]|uniref:Uncharacterized protein n=1 Tax=Lentinus brumalis TaxID=2498619 RepID=A0A371DH68_9APHY|nr:hypothetical protein OH76DRAFT_223889 [Polyporus brumalis]
MRLVPGSSITVALAGVVVFGGWGCAPVRRSVCALGLTSSAELDITEHLDNHRRRQRWRQLPTPLTMANWSTMDVFWTDITEHLDNHRRR